MSFNNGLERKKFEKEWQRLRAEYAASGMDEAAIDAMYEYDLSVFNSNRRYAEHTQSTRDFSYDEEKPEMGYRLLSAFTVPAKEVDADRSDSWIDEIEDERLLKVISQLKDDEIKLLTMLVYEGKTVTDAAEFFGLTHSTISYRFACIRKKFEKFF